ncbi:MAG: valine--tRNA ligase [Bacteroidetes bacterium CG02_land_8_20_14_3_00_31_25]|nr:MAG: valine--tRNA ligase [Bacteroidetes bacterium CG02_land_8_20_14_3_00_31_25]PIX35734.1 MAG: valine--tRNA ligase [Bacteroidetes bacterium CG_4_8_14_3_um_filter_31_14]
MKEIPSKYNPALIEDKWYSYWLQNGFFHSVPDDKPRDLRYTIVIPPPNVTGVLHMGHMLNNTLQDVLIRRARMLGKNACWVPGTDHASIATEARVVEKLKEQGIDKKSLTRDEFLKHAWEWKEKHGGIILEQLKKLGASCDWERTSFTMDEKLSESVINVFIKLYNKGLIYRGIRMVNWDPQAKTAVSDEEVLYREEQSNLYYVRYKIVDSENFITIATTRPETILGDTAVCVHPEDERYAHLKGKKVIVPLVNRIVPIIFDEYVDREFGTGALKITPAHDINDYQLGIKHHLENIDIFNDDGTLSEKAQLFIGIDRFVAKKQIVPELEKAGNLVKIEPYNNKIGYSERTNSVIEPKLSLQWFVKMKELSIPALENVLNNNIQIIPAKFKNTYKYWMENIKDWCISRQLWWGHRIPAWYIKNTNEFVIAKDLTDALILANNKFPDITESDLKQDEDVLDTWFSSWLWPISVFDGIRNPENADIKYYYPTNDLITAPEILFFWVARMIIAGYEFVGDKPFSNVYLTGIVRDKQGRKMSKSLGNSPDPVELMEKYGADGVRVGMLLCSPAGNDLPFDEQLMEQGRNFNNKIWNAFRLVNQWQIDENIEQPEHSKIAVEWFTSKLNKTIENINDDFSKYRISEALMEIYKLFWDEFSSWYLEIIKPAYQKPIDKKTLEYSLQFFEKLMKLLHPFIPFITEEIWHLIKDRDEKDCIMVSDMPKTEPYKNNFLNNFEEIKEIVSNIRAIRTEKGIAVKAPIELFFNSNNENVETALMPIISKLCNLSGVIQTSEKIGNAASFRVNTIDYFIPISTKINIEDEVNKMQQELNYLKGFLTSVNSKLSNQKFVDNAPEQVVKVELVKKSDAETKIKSLENQIQVLTIKQ